ncbi:MAG: hypothetical protein ACR2P9_00945 [Gammaproteobacteria bacterium]
MASFEEKFYLQNPGLLDRLKRDWRLVRESLQFLLLWATLGHRLRKACRKAKQDNTQVVLEDLLER